MAGNRMSVRRAKMELEFALVSGDQQRIADAERKLTEAIDERARKTKANQAGSLKAESGNA